MVKSRLEARSAGQLRCSPSIQLTSLLTDRSTEVASLLITRYQVHNVRNERL